MTTRGRPPRDCSGRHGPCAAGKISAQAGLEEEVQPGQSLVLSSRVRLSSRWPCLPHLPGTEVRARRPLQQLGTLRKAG